MKVFVLTIDYELFLGNDTGSVKDCMIEPTSKLASILEKNGSKMTVFWDILHYYRLIELQESYSKLNQDRLLIEEQILDLVRRGHDIQLHLHPHWLDAKYENGKWIFQYDRFKLHNLSEDNNTDNINTILGCISISKKLMEKLIRNVKPDYKVTTFRAGGYLIEPFHKISDSLLKNEIIIDSSVCPGLYNNNEISPYDFRNYPTKSNFRFDSTPKVILDKGNFIEIPISTIKLSGIINIYFKLLRRIRYPNLENERKGDGVGTISKKKEISRTKRLFSILFSSERSQFTTDSNFREKFIYLHKKVLEHSTMILHPKLLNRHTFRLLDDYVSTNKIRFISIQEFLT